MKVIVKINRSGYGEAWLGRNCLAKSDFFNVALVMDLLRSLGYDIEVEEIV